MSGANNGQGGQMSGYVGPPMIDPAQQTPSPPMMQAVPSAAQGGQSPVLMNQNPHQYGAPLTSQFVQNRGQLPRLRQQDN